MGWFKKSGFKNTISFIVAKGYNHIFTRKFTLSNNEEGEVFVNKKHKVVIISCSEYHEDRYEKSTGKKMGGALLGGAIAGGLGAVVGSIVVGNNQKKTDKYNILVVKDENGNIHEILLKDAFLQLETINSLFIK